MASWILVRNPEVTNLRFSIAGNVRLDKIRYQIMLVLTSF
ncbi:MAG: hypothetical protein ACI9Y7_001771 [Dokdonia sp.]|jgi:hypothetical protein